MRPINQQPHREPLLFFLLWNFTSKFRFLAFKADGEKWRVGILLSVVMKRVVIHGCLPCIAVLYRRRRRRHPSLASRHLLNVSLAAKGFHLRWPRSRRSGRRSQTDIQSGRSHTCVSGSLRGCNCYNNISIREAPLTRGDCFYSRSVFQRLCRRRESAVIENIKCR